MKEDLLSVTELAKLRRVTAETLRYYDRIDLIKPTYVDPNSNYRYYSIRQYEKVGTIRELRQLGLSVKEIQDYFDDRNLKKSTEILDFHYQRLQEEIRQKMLLSKALGQKLTFLREMSVPPVCDTVFEQHFPERYMLTYGEKAGGPREHAYVFTKLELCLDKNAPVLASERIGVYSEDGSILEEAEGYIPSVPMIFVEKGEVPEEHEKEIPAGRYVCMFYRGSGLEEYNPAFIQIRNYMQACGLVLNGPIFQIYKIDVTVTERDEESLMEIQVPVRGKTENRQ